MMAISILKVDLCVEHLPPIFQIVKLSLLSLQEACITRPGHHSSLLPPPEPGASQLISAVSFSSPELGRKRQFPGLAQRITSALPAESQLGDCRPQGRGPPGRGDLPIGNVSRASAPGHPTPLALKCVVFSVFLLSIGGKKNSPCKSLAFVQLL